MTNRNAAVVYRNLADAGSIIASSNLLLAPPTRVQGVHVGEKWRSQSASDHLLLDLGAATVLDTLAIMGVTATSYRFRVSSADATGATGDLFDSGVLSLSQVYLQAVAALSATVEGRYVRVDLVNAAGSYCEAGRLVVGARSGYRYNFGYGWTVTTSDPSLRHRTIGGQTQIDRRPIYRIAEMPFEWVHEDDRYGFVEDIERESALSRDVLMITDQGSDNLARDTIWGLIADASPIVQPFHDIFAKTYRIEERL